MPALSTAIHLNPADDGRSRNDARLREASLKDHAAIAALQSRNGLRMRPCQEWKELWRANPVWRRSQGRWPIGWVAETEGGEIVGSISNIPCAYHFKGRELRAAAACAWVVDKSYRRYSMELLGRVVKQSGIDFAVSTTVSAKSEAGVKFFRWSRVPVGTWNQTSYWITHYRGFLEAALRWKSVPLAGVASYPAAAGVFGWDQLRAWGMRRGEPSWEIEMRSDFDDRFDDFWDELRREKNDTLLAFRTREALSWLFRYSLARGNAWILTISRGSRLLSYAVFDRQDEAVSGLRRIRLVDFQALKGCQNSLSSFLSWMLRKCRELDSHVLEYPGCGLSRPGWPHVPAPHRRNLSSWTHYYKPFNTDMAEILSNPSVWEPSLFDGDASL